MTRQAHCDSCAITYRVPGARRMYRCKSCNAELEPRDEPEPTGHEPCHACSALQPASASFCAACGEDLDPASEEAWRAAGKDLRQALKRLRRFRASMLANTSIYLLILLVFLVLALLCWLWC